MMHINAVSFQIVNVKSFKSFPADINSHNFLKLFLLQQIFQFLHLIRMFFLLFFTSNLFRFWAFVIVILVANFAMAKWIREKVANGAVLSCSFSGFAYFLVSFLSLFSFLFDNPSLSFLCSFETYKNLSSYYFIIKNELLW